MEPLASKSGRSPVRRRLPVPRRNRCRGRSPPCPTPGSGAGSCSVRSSPATSSALLAEVPLSAERQGKSLEHLGKPFEPSPVGGRGPEGLLQVTLPARGKVLPVRLSRHSLPISHLCGGSTAGVAGAWPETASTRFTQTALGRGSPVGVRPGPDGGSADPSADAQDRSSRKIKVLESRCSGSARGYRGLEGPRAVCPDAVRIEVAPGRCCPGSRSGPAPAHRCEAR